MHETILAYLARVVYRHIVVIDGLFGTDKKHTFELKLASKNQYVHQDHMESNTLNRL